MRPLKRVSGGAVVQQTVSQATRLALYDQYGAMAYGVITQIISQPDVAQAVLIDLFASTQMDLIRESPGNTACAIIRLARSKALEAQSMNSVESVEPEYGRKSNDNLPKFIFNLLFTQGFKPEAVAKRLDMTYWDVVAAMREHVRSMRTH